MRSARAENTLRNTRWGLLRRTLSLLLPFAVRTILIHTLGAAYAGLSSLFVSVLSVLNLAELGVSNAVTYSMYKPVAEGDTARVCALLAEYRKAYRIIGTAVCVLGLAAAPFLPYLIRGGLPDTVNLYLLYFIYLADLAAGYFLYGYQSCILSVHQREDAVSRNAVAAGILLRVLQCTVLLAFRNYILFAALIPAATVFQNLLTHRSVCRLFPGIVPAGRISPAEKAELKKNIAGLAIWKAGSASRNAFDSIVLSLYLGLTPVAVYNNYMMILKGTAAFLGVILTSMLAGVGNKIALEAPEENYRDFRRFHFLYMWASGWCTVCMMCLFQPFMRQWMGQDMLVPDTAMFLFCGLFFMLRQGDVNSVYYQAAGLWWQGRWRSVIEAASNLVLNLALGKLFGLTGILCATIISYTIAYFYGSRYTFTCFFRNGKLPVFYLDNMKYLLVTAGSAYLTFRLTGAAAGMTGSAAADTLCCLLICAVVPNALFAAVYCLNPECREWLRYARDRILRKGAAQV